MTEEHSSSIRICQEGHANAIALNREYTQIAVAGRSRKNLNLIEMLDFERIRTSNEIRLLSLFQLTLYLN